MTALSYWPLYLSVVFMHEVGQSYVIQSKYNGDKVDKKGDSHFAICRMFISCCYKLSRLFAFANCFLFNSTLVTCLCARG